jgi:hypothetical protein
MTLLQNIVFSLLLLGALECLLSWKLRRQNRMFGQSTPR